MTDNFYDPIRSCERIHDGWQTTVFYSVMLVCCAAVIVAIILRWMP
jgi:hypothetical protein